MTNETFSDIYNKSLDLLSRREHSQKEIKLKLHKKFNNTKEIDEVVKKLEANNIINDTRFTEHYINLRKRRGFGSKKISYERLLNNEFRFQIVIFSIQQTATQPP